MVSSNPPAYSCPSAPLRLSFLEELAVSFHCLLVFLSGCSFGLVSIRRSGTRFLVPSAVSRCWGLVSFIVRVRSLFFRLHRVFVRLSFAAPSLSMCCSAASVELSVFLLHSSLRCGRCAIRYSPGTFARMVRRRGPKACRRRACAHCGTVFVFSRFAGQVHRGRLCRCRMLPAVGRCSARCRLVDASPRRRLLVRLRQRTASDPPERGRCSLPDGLFSRSTAVFGCSTDRNRVFFVFLSGYPGGRSPSVSTGPAEGLCR